MQLKFEPISLEKQNEYLNRLAACPQKTSDYSFINLWGWAEEYGMLWAWEDQLVWILQTVPEKTFWAPIGPWEKIDWNQYISEIIPRKTLFTRVPEKLTETWRETLSEKIEIEEVRGHWDYLYDVSELVSLKGNRFHKKKNLLNQFLKKYNSRYLPLGPGQINQARSLQTDWCTWRDCESIDTLSAENRSIQRVLANWNDLPGLTGGALMVEDEMVAYTVAERLTEDMVVVHFEKANPDYKGGYQAINQMFLAHNENTFKIVNREQDLDDEGLRKAKLSYHPIGFLRKYQVAAP